MHLDQQNFLYFVEALLRHATIVALLPKPTFDVLIADVFAPVCLVWLLVVLGLLA